MQNSIQMSRKTDFGTTEITRDNDTAKKAGLSATRIYSHGLPLTRMAERLIDVWADYFNTLAMIDDKYQYTIHIWQCEDYIHIEAGFNITLDSGIEAARTIIMGDTGVTTPTFLPMDERNEYWKRPLEILMSETSRMLHDEFGFDGITRPYELKNYENRFNFYEPVLLRKDGRRINRKGTVILDTPQSPFALWTLDEITMMI